MFGPKKGGLGRNALFWLENWSGYGTFADRFPSIFNFDKKKSCFISDRINSNRKFNCAWKKNPSNLMEHMEVNAFWGLFIDGLSVWGG
uniref:Uncharacterized protein n=1 Tax=Lactuca sativa TaxID=4236 RepID=A0A9R1WBZ1_LACSA|nr:hypothetical protein LSAT_V11C200092670 [Lactuca sativa]